MTVRTKLGAYVFIGCSLAVAGCAQPSLWSKMSNSSTVGSPAYRAPAGAPGARNDYRTNAQANGAQESSGGSLADLARDPVNPSRSSAIGAANKASATKTATASKNDKGPSEHSQMTLARLNERQKLPGDAERIYMEVLKKNPRNAEAWHRLGIVCAQGAKYDNASECFNKYEELVAQPTAEYYNDKGYCLYLQQKLDEAEETLRKAVELDRENMAAVNNLGLVLGAQHRFDEALAMFKKAGTDAQARANLAYVYTQMGELDHAEAHYVHALTLDHNLKSAANALVQVHEKRQNLAMKGPPTSLAVKPNLDRDAGSDLADVAEADAPATKVVHKAADVEVVVIDEPAPRAATKHKPETRPSLAHAAPPVEASEMADIEANEELPPAVELPAPKSLSIAERSHATPAAKPVAAPATRTDERLAVVHHVRAEEANVKAEAVQAVKEEEVSTDENLPPVVTADQYKVRRTSAEMPVVRSTAKPAATLKSPQFNYSGASEPKAAPRMLDKIFGAP